jgi:outer membrane protein assembly factor BamB
MLSKSTLRFSVTVVAICVAVTLVACSTPPTRETVERQYRGTVLELVPDARIFSNDLAAGGPVSVRGSWLLENMLVIEFEDSELIALDRKSLAPLWTFSGMNAPLDFPPSVTPVAVLAISDGMLYEIDRVNGNQLFVGILKNVPSAGPAGSESTAYVPALASATGNRTVTTVNLVNGTEGWGRATRGSITVAPLLGGSSGRPILYLATDRGGVYAFPAEPAVQAAPDPSWSNMVHGRIIHQPVISDDLFLVGSERGDLWALDRITGNAVWVHYSGVSLLASAWPAGDQVYFVNERGFHALAREGGDALWSFEGLARFVCRRGDTVYAVTNPGQAAAFDAKTGEMLRQVTYAPDAVLLSNTADNILYAISRDGLVLAVDKALD